MPIIDFFVSIATDASKTLRMLHFILHTAALESSISQITCFLYLVLTSILHGLVTGQSHILLHVILVHYNQLLRCSLAVHLQS